MLGLAYSANDPVRARQSMGIMWKVVTCEIDMKLLRQRKFEIEKDLEEAFGPSCFCSVDY